MFKKVTALLITLCLSIYLIYLPYQVQADIVETPVTKLQQIPYANTISLSGTIQGEDTAHLFLAIPVIPNKIFVKQGQRVTKGDLLFTVDINQLKEYLQTTLVSGGSDSADLLHYISAFLNTEEKIQAALKDIKTHYYAEKDGVISSLNIEENALSNPLMPVLSITGSAALIVAADLPSEHIGKVELGQLATIDLKTGEYAIYTGRVKHISGIAQNKLQGTHLAVVVPIELSIDNNGASGLLPGLKAEVEIQIEEEKNISFLPYASVSQDDGGEFVYLLKGNSLEKRYIEVGEDLKEGVQVVSGIEEEDILVKDIAKIKEDTQKVKVVQG